MRLLALALAAFAAMFVPDTAFASMPGLQPGVHVDPRSPAGKEYQIPITAARGQAAGGSSAGSANPPLFGVGVSPPSARPADAGGGSPASGGAGSTLASGANRQAASRSDSRPHSSAKQAGASGVESSGAPRPSSSDPTGTSAGAPGGNGWIALVGGGLLVVVLGGGGGLAIRQRALRG